MAIALVTNVAARSTGSGGVTTTGVDTTGANLICIGICYFSGVSSLSVSDSKGNSWSALTARNAGDAVFAIYYCASPTVGSGHTFTIGGTNAYGTIGVAAFSGAQASSPFDQQNGATVNPGTSLATGSVTPTTDGQVLFTGLTKEGTAGVPTIDLSFTITDHLQGVAGAGFGGDWAYLIQGTAAARNPTWTFGTNAEVATAIATFKAAAATGVKRLLLLGVG